MSTNGTTKRKRITSTPRQSGLKRKKKGQEEDQLVNPVLVNDNLVEIFKFLGNDEEDPVVSFKRLLQMRRVSKTIKHLVYRAMDAKGLLRRLFPKFSDNALTFDKACEGVKEIEERVERFVAAFIHFGIPVLDEPHDVWWRRSSYPAFLVVGSNTLSSCWMLDLNEDDNDAQYKEILETTDPVDSTHLRAAIRSRNVDAIRLALREYFFNITLDYRLYCKIPRLYAIKLRPDGPDPNAKTFVSMFQFLPPSYLYNINLPGECVAYEILPPPPTIAAV
jgi:hypothetical protein